MSLASLNLSDALLTHRDYYMHLADFKSYLDADHAAELYADPKPGRAKPS